MSELGLSENTKHTVRWHFDRLWAAPMMLEVDRMARQLALRPARYRWANWQDTIFVDDDGCTTWRSPVSGKWLRVPKQEMRGGR